VKMPSCCLCIICLHSNAAPNPSSRSCVAFAHPSATLSSQWSMTGSSDDHANGGAPGRRRLLLRISPRANRGKGAAPACRGCAPLGLGKRRRTSVVSVDAVGQHDPRCAPVARRPARDRLSLAIGARDRRSVAMHAGASPKRIRLSAAAVATLRLASRSEDAPNAGSAQMKRRVVGGRANRSGDR
jgi:hypothetical protein